MVAGARRKEEPMRSTAVQYRGHRHKIHPFLAGATEVGRHKSRSGSLRCAQKLESWPRARKMHTMLRMYRLVPFALLALWLTGCQSSSRQRVATTTLPTVTVPEPIAIAPPAPIAE